jgi:hypothetical protein
MNCLWHELKSKISRIEPLAHELHLRCIMVSPLAIKEKGNCRAISHLNEIQRISIYVE